MAPGRSSSHSSHRPNFNVSRDVSLFRSMPSAPDVTRWWASLCSPHPTMDGSDFCCGSRRGSLMVMVVDGAGAQRCPPKPPTKLQCTPRAFLFRSMPSAPDVSRWWASLRSPHPTMGRCGLMVLRVARYLVVFLRGCHLRLMSAAPDVSRWWASLRSPHPTMGRRGLMVLRVARYLAVFLRGCHHRLMFAAPDVSRWWGRVFPGGEGGVV
jgi:hypothetical protein